MQHLGERGDCLHEYHTINAQLQKQSSPELLKRLDIIQHQMDDLDCWTIQKDVDALLQQLQLQGQADFQSLSDGFSKKLALV